MRHLSTRDLADALGVSESSLKRWVDAGKILATRTDGGHRRIALPEAVRFVRDTGAPIARPELLDMPEVAAAQARALTHDSFFDYLIEGDVTGARGWLLLHYLSGVSVAALCDGPVRAAMRRLGELWHHDPAGIFLEHRATDACLQAFAHLRNLTEVPAGAPLAVGAASEDDPYLLPSFLAATVVASAGMRAINLGASTPLIAMQAACARHRPRLVWLSLSSPVPARRARALARWLAALPPSTVAVVGGRERATIATPRRVRRVDTMQELGAIAAEIVAT